MDLLYSSHEKYDVLPITVLVILGCLCNRRSLKNLQTNGTEHIILSQNIFTSKLKNQTLLAVTIKLKEQSDLSPGNSGIISFLTL